VTVSSLTVRRPARSIRLSGRIFERGADTVRCTNTERSRDGGGGLKPDQCRRELGWRRRPKAGDVGRDFQGTEVGLKRTECAKDKEWEVTLYSMDREGRTVVCVAAKKITHGARVERKQEARGGTKQRQKRARPHIGHSIRHFYAVGILTNELLARWAHGRTFEARVEIERFSIRRLLLNDDVAARDYRE
jgi:hypothetical protein